VGVSQGHRSRKSHPIDEAEIQPGSDGHDHLSPDQSFHFEATVAVKPEVRLPDYSAIKIERNQPEVTDADVEALVQEIQQRNATLEPKRAPRISVTWSP
jgi:trigger factor